MSQQPRVVKRMQRQPGVDVASFVDLRGGFGENLKEVAINVSAPDASVAVTRKIALFNAFVRVLQRSRIDAVDQYCIDEFLVSIRKCLVHGNKAVRAGAIRSLRYMLNSRAFFDLLLQMKIDLFVMKSLDTLDSRPVERVQALRLVRKVLSVCPDLMPRSLTVSLVAAAEGFSHDDKMAGAALETLAELALLNPSIVAFHRGFKAILRGVIECQSAAMTESLLCTILYLLNHPQTRCYIRPHTDLEAIVAPFTDLHYRHRPETGPQQENKEDHQVHLFSARTAVVTMLRCWAGLVCFCDPSGWGISSFVGVLQLPCSLVQRNIMEVLFDLFKLNIPEWTDDFDAALASTDPRRKSELWRLEEEWVIEEAKHILPKLTKGRTNLLTCYLALLLTTFINAGLLEKLVIAAKSEDKLISTQATILLGELLHLANKILPPEYAAQTHCLPSLMEIATSFQSSPAERNKASAVVSCLEKLHQKRKARPWPNSLYLQLTLRHSGCFELKDESVTLYRPSVQHVPSKDSDEVMLETLLRDSLVLSTKDYTQWNWDVISTLLKSPRITMKKLEETSTTKFTKRLCYFYKPSSGLFSTIELARENVQRYSSVGAQLMHFVLTGDEGVKYLMDILLEIKEHLAKICDQGSQPDSSHHHHHQYSHQDGFSLFAVSHTMTRDYFLLIGHLSSNLAGLQILKKTNIFNYFLTLCDHLHRRDINRLVLTSLDYSQDALCRVVLSKQLTCIDMPTRKYATMYMRVLLRARLPAFKDWGIPLIITQLYDPDESISNDALDILDEACDVPSYCSTVVLNFPALLHLGPRGTSLLTRFLSANRGLWLLKGSDFIDQEMDKWLTDFNKRYVGVVEQRLFSFLSSYWPSTEGVYTRRSQFRSYRNYDMSVPVHFYGQLVQLKDGCQLLQQKRHLDYLIESLDQPSLGQEHVLEKKASLWALGHIGTSHWGMQMLSTRDIVEKIVRIAEKSQVMSLKGTAYYCLCLLARTKLGADCLRDLDWLPVCHASNNTWPILETRTAAASQRDSEVFSDEDATSVFLDESVERRRGSLGTVLESKSLVHFTKRPRTLTEQKQLRSLAEWKEEERVTLSGRRSNRPGVLRTEAEKQANMKWFSRRASYTEVSTGSEEEAGGRIGSGGSGGSDERNVSSQTNGQRSQPNFIDFIGVVLPKNLNSFYMVSPCGYEGSWPSAFPPEIDVKFVDRLEKKKSVVTLDQNTSNSADTDCSDCSASSSKSKNPSTSEPTTEQIRKELIRLVGCLGTSVGSRATQQGLMLLKDRHPRVFTKPSVFVDILEILSSYHFSFGARRFCYALFDIDFNTFVLPQDAAASPSPSPASSLLSLHSNGDVKDALSEKRKRMTTPDMLKTVKEEK